MKIKYLLFLLLVSVTSVVYAMDENTSLLKQGTKGDEIIEMAKLQQQSGHSIQGSVLQLRKDQDEKKPFWWKKNKKYVYYTGDNTAKYAIYFAIAIAVLKAAAQCTKNINVGWNCLFKSYEPLIFVGLITADVFAILGQRYLFTSIENRKAVLIYVMSAFIAAGVILPAMLLS